MSDRSRRNPFQAFFICLIAYTTAQMDLALFGYAVPAIRAEFALSLSEIMAIVSVAFLLGGTLLVLLGWLADRIAGGHAGVGGAFVLTLDALPSGLEVEEIVDRVSKGVSPNYG